MTDEPDIIRQLRKEEKLGLLHSKTESTHEVKFVKQPPGEIPDRNLDCIESGIADSNMDDTLCNILLDDLYKVAFDLSPDCIIILDLHGVVQSCNTGTVAKLGWQKEEIIGRHISEISVFRTDDASERLKSFSAVLGGRDVESFETEIVCRDGSSFFAEVRPILLKKDGEKIGVLTIWRDITKNIKINQTLNRYEKIIKTVKHPMSLINTHYMYQTINDAYLLFLNKSREEIEGHSSEEVLGKEFFEKQIKPYFDKCLKGEELRYQVSLNIPSKEERILEIEAYPYFDSDGTISGVVTNTIDITDQRKKEEIIVQSEKKYHELANSLPQVVYETDENANITFVSQVSLSMTGYTEEDFKGLNALQIVAPVDRERMRSNILKILQGEIISSNEYLMQRKDGSTFPALFHSTPILRDNKIVGLRGFAVDITEQKQVENKVIESEEKLRRILDSSPDAITVTDLNGNIIECNQATSMMHGFNKKELIGKNALELFSPKDLERVKESLKKIFESESVKNLEYTLLTKDGQEFPAEFSACLIRDASDNPQSFVAITRDITERRRVEGALRDSEERFRTIFDSAIDGILIADMENKNFFICNKAICDMLGYRAEEIKNLGVMEIHPKEDLPFVVEQFNKQARREIVLAKNIPMKRKDGSVFYADINSVPLTISRKTYLMGSFRDITERKQTEKEIQRIHELLQRANTDLERKIEDGPTEIHLLLKQKDEFINQLGHDLKNPLTPIITLLPILKKQACDTESLEYFDVVIRNVEYMKNLVMKILDLARLNSSNTLFDFEDIDLTEKINDIVSTQKIMFQAKHIIVGNKIQETIIVQADTLRLEELLKNLLTNAVKYTPDGGSITLDVTPEEENITVSIQDTGIGLTKEQIVHIFDEFYKVDQSRHDFDSSGLGLPICKRIVEKHGGKIWVESEGLGKGCTVYFTIKTGGKGSMDKVVIV